ncbi:MAG: U32 family peptidase [Oscillospiraceae bacterium]|nr:U32 family peptidase [Oscillospiraceae bacterium]
MNRTMAFRIQVSTLEQLSEALKINEFEYIYAPLNLISSDIYEKNRIIVVPSAFKCEQMISCRKMGFTRALAHTLGHIPIIQDAEMFIHGGFRLNITNSVALEQYMSLGLTDAILSIEINLNRIKALNRVLPYGLIVYGNLPVMLLRRIPGSDGLTDRKGKFFPLRGTRSKTANEVEVELELYNPDTLILSDKMSDFENLDFVVFLMSPDDSVQKVLEMYINETAPSIKENFTRGLYRK